MSWLNYCTQNHRLLCRFEPLPVHGVKVIDCTTLQIEDHNVNTPYVSLSYVWGKPKDACGPVETIRGRKSLPQRLSPVIRDSIQVTKTLGYRYLWIDKFCIDQDAVELKHDQIQQMDAIYKNSELTIIGAAGQDESYGLPGVGARGRRHQFVAKLDGATLFWNPIDPHELISLSHWSTRGWTFQEALLSRRRLVFTEDQVYFQCNTMNCFE
ncbi:HET-domain-containing protein, partial [Alternaria alternata]